MRFSNHKIISFIASVCLTATMMGENPVISEILRDNPTLSALRSSQKAEFESYGADNTLNGPEAEFEYLRGADGQTKWSFGVTQGFDWPGVYSARKKVNESRHSAFEYILKARSLDIAVEANSLLIQYHYASLRREALLELKSALIKINESLESGLEAGSVTIIDKMKAELEQNSVDRDIRLVDASLAAIKTNLIELAGREIDLTMINPVITPELSDNAESYIQTAVESDPVLEAAIATSAVCRLEADVTRKSGLPSFSVGYRHEREEGVHFNGFAVSVALPSWGLNKRRLAAASAITASLSEEDRIRVSLTARIRSEWNQAAALKRDLEASNDREFRNKYVKLLEEAYQAGELSVLDFVREVTYCREVAMNLIDLREQYAQLIASLNRYELF